MDPIDARQYPMDMGAWRAHEIMKIFQYFTQNTMNMGSTPGGF
jgi:hypothetical protein